MNRKQILFDLINDKKTCGCSLLGYPTQELKEYMLRGKNIMTLFKNKGIEIPFEFDPDGFEHTYINVYISRANKNIYSISISEKIDLTIDLVNKIIDNFFVEIVELYQYDILSAHIDMILSSNYGKLKFEDILMYINRNNQQKDISEKLNLSRQLITELKKERANMSLKTLSSFISEFPLLPWFEYLKEVDKNA